VAPGEVATLLETVRQSIQDNRVDVYLQPIVTLPQRKPRYYEALTRLRNGEGEIILPADYLEVAEPAGIMPLIDNLLLFRSVQIVRKLSDRNREIGIFCNISANSLVDPDFFPQFIEFMEHNRDLAKSIVFEFSQATISGAGPLETESLAALRQQGCRFSIDHVQNLDLDLPALAEQGFRFLKVDAATLLAGAPAGAQIHMDDYSSLLARYGIKLVAEKIETERTVLELLELDVGFGQGFLFSEPRPVRSEFLEGDAPPPLRAAV
jgi:cyclic-di-GMP phosphodiesterase TipF (flagellum assembly factor)